jgi:hypothetical protein
VSAPSSEADLIETLRSIVFGVKVCDLPSSIIIGLRERRWIEISLSGLELTASGHAVLENDGSRALNEIFQWLKSEAANEFFRR